MSSDEEAIRAEIAEVAALLHGARRRPLTMVWTGNHEPIYHVCREGQETRAEWVRRYFGAELLETPLLAECEGRASIDEF